MWGYFKLLHDFRICVLSNGKASPLSLLQREEGVLHTEFEVCLLYTSSLMIYLMGKKPDRQWALLFVFSQLPVWVQILSSQCTSKRAHKIKGAGLWLSFPEGRVGWLSNFHTTGSSFQVHRGQKGEESQGTS